MGQGNCGNRIWQSARFEVVRPDGLTREDWEKLRVGEWPGKDAPRIAQGGKLPSAIQKIPLCEPQATKLRRTIPDVLAVQNVPLASVSKKPNPKKRDDMPCFPTGY